MYWIGIEQMHMVDMKLGGCIISIKCPIDMITYDTAFGEPVGSIRYFGLGIDIFVHIQFGPELALAVWHSELCKIELLFMYEGLFLIFQNVDI